MRVLSFVLMMVLAGQTALSAQVAESQPSLPAGQVDTGSLLSDLGRQQLARASYKGVGYHTFFTLGFGLVGTGLGFFASHIAYNDWDKVDNTTFSTQRRAFSVSGAVIGGVAGLIMSLRDQTSPQPGAIPIRQVLGRDFITAVEIERTTATNLMQAISAARPEWLLTRGTGSIREGAQGFTGDDGRSLLIVPGEETIKVYVDETYIGGLGALENIPVASVIRVDRLSAAQATNRYGAGHLHGAIVVQTVDGR